MNMQDVILALIVCIRHTICVIRELTDCHENFYLKPSDGLLKVHTFTWLGFVQYNHVTTGLPHHSKAPRVVLIHKQYAAATARDMLHLPKNYKLGNIIFGEYERDEEDCGLNRVEVKMGATCPRAYLEMPFVDITPHPEFSRFGVGNSLALVRLIRPMKSHYMLPACLPSLGERYRKKKNKAVFMKLGSEGVTHVLCTSGCGVRPGAPIISQNIDGSFELIGIAAGGAACTRRAMRRRLIDEPPLYIDIYPYVTWIINVVTANKLPKPYPHNFMLMEGGQGITINRGYLREHREQRSGWRARIFVSGDHCYKSTKKQALAAFFYSERFEVNAGPPAKLNFFMKISAGVSTTILCARLSMPNRMVKPIIKGVGRYNISVEFNSKWFPSTFYFSLGLSGKNTTANNLEKWIWERTPGFE